LKNYYEILEINPDADVAEIRDSYSRLVKKNLWNKDTFADLKEAYDVLATPGKRSEYDRAAIAEGVSKAVASTTRRQSEGAPPETGRRCPMGASAQCPVVSARVPLLEAYCPECGIEIAAMPVIAGRPEEIMDQKWFGRLEEETGRQHRLRIGETTVGREEADITLPDKTISRLHARLQASADKEVVVEDLGSTNGTQVNGERLAPHTPRTLVDGDTVRFGSIRLRYRAVDSASAPSDAHEILPLDMPPIVPLLSPQEPVLGSEPFLLGSFLDSQPQPPALNPLERLFRAPLGTAVNARAKLVATRGDMISEHPLIEGVTTFGRRADSTLVLRNDPYVSGSHAQIIGEGEVFQLTDVGSTNGTLLNGERLMPNQPIILNAGDEIVIGGTIFRFEPNNLDASGATPPGL
jgi:pSer/pThr/pTyr-binding forkhead associated (FHA) protein